MPALRIVRLAGGPLGMRPYGVPADAPIGFRAVAKYDGQGQDMRPVVYELAAGDIAKYAGMATEEDMVAWAKAMGL